MFGSSKSRYLLIFLVFTRVRTCSEGREEKGETEGEAQKFARRLVEPRFLKTKKERGGENREGRRKQPGTPHISYL